VTLGIEGARGALGELAGRPPHPRARPVTQGPNREWLRPRLFRQWQGRNHRTLLRVVGAVLRRSTPMPMLRLEAMARVAAQEAPQYSSGTVRERKPTKAPAFIAYLALVMTKSLLAS